MNVHSLLLIEVKVSKEVKRDAILQAALELVAEKGFHDAPCSMIAEQAGVAAGTIYRYFESKDSLILELYIEIEGRITTVLLQDYLPEQQIKERFLHLVIGILKYFINNPLEFKYVEQFHHSPYGTDFRRDRLLGNLENGNNHSDSSQKCDIYKQLFMEGLEKQIIKNLPLPILFDLAFGPITSVARNHILGFVKLHDDLIQQIATACWDSLKR